MRKKKQNLDYTLTTKSLHSVAVGPLKQFSREYTAVLMSSLSCASWYVKWSLIMTSTAPVITFFEIFKGNSVSCRMAKEQEKISKKHNTK